MYLYLYLHRVKAVYHSVIWPTLLPCGCGAPWALSGRKPDPSPASSITQLRVSIAAMAAASERQLSYLFSLPPFLSSLGVLFSFSCSLFRQWDYFFFLLCSSYPCASTILSITASAFIFNYLILKTENNNQLNRRLISVLGVPHSRVSAVSGSHTVCLLFSVILRLSRERRARETLFGVACVRACVSARVRELAGLSDHITIIIIIIIDRTVIVQYINV